MMYFLVAAFGTAAFVLGCGVAALYHKRFIRGVSTENSQLHGRMKALFENAPAELYLKDCDGRYLMINPEFERLFDVKQRDVIGKLPTDIHDLELGEKTLAHDKLVLDNQATVVRDELAQTADGLRTLHTVKFPTFDDSGKPTGIGAVVTDVTELRAVELELRQYQKSEAIGHLTGGVAHDFNNLLAVIIGNLELNSYCSTETERTACISEALTAARKGADLIKSLLSFARKAPLKTEQLDLVNIVQETEKWSKRILPSNINLSCDVEKNVWPILSDESMLQAAIINLLINARDALSEGGEITMTVSNVALRDPPPNLVSGEFTKGDYVCLEIKDDGEGIPEGLIDEVFTPYFTTKEVGQGSGLGLPMVLGFVRQSGGFLELTSVEGTGTKIRMYFQKSVPSPHAENVGPIKAQGVSANKVNVLVVEDEPQVRQMLTKSLQKLGFSVTDVESGDVAWALFENTKEKFDVVVTDIVMPGELQGPDLASRVRKASPRLPIIFISGYENHESGNMKGIFPEEIYLAKPLGIFALVEAIDMALLRSSKPVIGKKRQSHKLTQG